MQQTRELAVALNRLMEKFDAVLDPNAIRASLQDKTKAEQGAKALADAAKEVRDAGYSLHVTFSKGLDENVGDARRMFAYDLVSDIAPSVTLGLERGLKIKLDEITETLSVEAQNAKGLFAGDRRAAIKSYTNALYTVANYMNDFDTARRGTSKRLYDAVGVEHPAVNPNEMVFFKGGAIELM